MIPELTTEGPLHLMRLLGLEKFHISQKSHMANIWLMQFFADLFHYCNLVNAFLGYLSSLMLFFAQKLPKNCSNEVNWLKKPMSQNFLESLRKIAVMINCIWGGSPVN